MNESMNDEAVCRTAPATPGLLIITKTMEMLLQSNNFRVDNLIWETGH